MKVHIHHVNESFVQIGGEISIFQEIYDRYTYFAKDYMFNPKYKAGIWDGKIRLLNSRNRFAPKGLVPEIIDYCVQQGYQISLDPEFSRFKEEYPINDDFWETPYDPHDFQERAVRLSLSKKRQLILSATSSGKSLIIYGIVRSLPGKTLIIVPSSNLVTQLGRKDFIDYAQNVVWEPEKEVHLVYDGATRHTSKNIIISTWQSLQHEKDPEFFTQFDNVIVDEVHKAKATEIKRIIESCVNAFVRIGLTGSLDKSTANITLLKGLFGPTVRVSTTAELMKRGIVSSMDIRCVVLKYSDDIAKELRGIPYVDEVKWLESSTKRLQLMSNLVKVMKGNSLILVNHINKHGKLIYEKLQADHPDKQIHWINKDVKVDDRDDIKELMESTAEGVIVIASYALFSTGISIKNLHNVVYGASTKALTTILQSIGRGLRKHASKEKFLLWDLVDDLRGNRKSPNHSYKHFKERLEIYLSEQFNVSISEVSL